MVFVETSSEHYPVMGSLSAGWRHLHFSLVYSFKNSVRDKYTCYKLCKCLLGPYFVKIFWFV